MRRPVATYRGLLTRRVEEAKPGLGWLMAIQKQSLPWVAAILLFVAAAWLIDGLPLWLTVALWALAFGGWLFVNVTMISGIVRVKDRMHG